jgi:glycosyltransferase involved in cell wall biosynthesis
MNKNIFFFWNDITLYAAYQLKYLINNTKYNFIIITNKKNFQFKSIKKILDNKIFYTNKKNINYLRVIKKEPDFIFSSGWAYKEINKFIKSIKKIKPSVKTIMMVDNCKKENFRQFIGKFFFNFYIKKYYDCYWVPGNSSVNLLNFFKVKKEKIFTGLYSFNDRIFRMNIKLENRDSNFVFIGQLIDRKNFFLLIKSFLLFKIKNTNNSKLFIIGNNTNKLNLNKFKNKNIFFKLNQSSVQTSKILNKCRFFVLPSRDDHWPLALLEALACGCAPIVSKFVGSISDLKCGHNIKVLPNLEKKTLSNIFLSALRYDSHRLRSIEKINKNISKKYSNDNFLLNFNKIINYLNKH